MNMKLDRSHRRITGSPLLAVLASVLFAAWFAVADSSPSWRYFVYSVEPNGTVTIWNNLGVRGTVSIPSEVDGHPVTRVGSATFAFNSGVTNVIIPSPVNYIETAAFYHCVNLRRITLPASVVTIEPGAFDYCVDLRSIDVNSLNPYFTTVDGALFTKDRATLMQFPGGRTNGYVIPDGVTRIEGYAFGSLYSVTNVVIPASVREIGSSAFYGCSGLTSITLPEGLTVISSNLFQNCAKLTSITIPDSVREIQQRAFQNCTSLTNVTLGRSVASIDNNAFEGCTNLTSLTVPDSTAAIANYAFANCTSLTNVYIGNGVTAIGASAFSGCSRLADIRIGRSVVAIGDQAFTGCLSLRAITVDALNPAFSSVDGVLFNQRKTMLVQYPTARIGKYVIPDGVEIIGTYAFSSASGLTGVTFPSSVTNIASFAFFRCPQLVNITLPAGLLSIGRSAFNYNSLLTGLYFEGNQPSLGEYAFNHDSKLTIYILAGTSGWKSKYGGRPTSRWDTNSTKLEVAIVGSGALTPNYSEAMRQLGSTNTMTAAGANGYAFQKWLVSTNWGDSVTSTNAKLTFVMQSNLTIAAVFIPATYVGLYLPAAANEVAPTNAGSVTITLTDKRALSGKMILAGKSLSFSGGLDWDNRVSITNARSGNTPLFIDIGLDSLSVTGRVSSTGWSSPLQALPRATATSNILAGNYTMLAMGELGTIDAPPGDSPMKVTVTLPYTVKVTGSMADGSPVNVTTTLTMSDDGVWPFYASLYSGNGLVIGWLAFASNAATPSVQWVKAPNAANAYYPAGFSKEPDVALKRYVAPASTQNALGWTNGMLFLGSGNLSAPIQTEVIVTNNRIKSVSGSVSNLSLVITNSTGLFGGSFVHPVTRKSVAIRGAVVQGLPWEAPANQVGVGGGWFPGTNEYGSVWIEPKP